VKLLLDTHTLLWWAEDHPRLGKRARKSLIAHGGFVSIVSAWELAIKVGIGKLRLGLPVERFVRDQVDASGFDVLPIELEHGGLVENLPWHHGDPFDRLLAAQAISASLTIVSADKVFARYGVKRLW
jgi:PIN domain nuclease of toxin-antitoxin system